MARLNAAALLGDVVVDLPGESERARLDGLDLGVALTENRA